MIVKPFQKIFLWWLLPASVTVLAVLIEADYQWGHLHIRLITTVSSLLGTVAFFLFRGERHTGSRAVFLNFSILFVGNGVGGPLQLIVLKWQGLLGSDLDSQIHVYLTAFYFFMLLFSVLYLLMECTSRASKVLAKYVITFIVAGGASALQYYPYLHDSRYLHETANVRDYREVKGAIDTLRSVGHSSPSVHQIVALSQSKSSKRMGTPLTIERVLEILPYLHENDFGILFFRPLWRSNAWISVIIVILMIAYFFIRYFIDPPASAYLEKIALCLLPYCFLEVVHHYYFMSVASWDLAVGFSRVGGFVSLAAMIPLGYLFALRYTFIHSIEGSYYERKLNREASRITRWRDGVDNWVLRQFVNESDLNRRFVIRDPGVESNDRDARQ